MFFLKISDQQPFQTEDIPNKGQTLKISVGRHGFLNRSIAAADTSHASDFTRNCRRTEGRDMNVFKNTKVPLYFNQKICKIFVDFQTVYTDPT